MKVVTTFSEMTKKGVLGPQESAWKETPFIFNLWMELGGGGTTA